MARKKYSELTEEQRKRKRELVRECSKRKKEREALAAGRIPGAVGRPRKFTDDERALRRQEAVRRYYQRHLDLVRKREAKRHRDKRRADAAAAGREIAKPGERYSVKPRTKEERLALRRKAYAERYRERYVAKMRAQYAADPEKFIERIRQLKQQDPERYRKYKATGGRNRRARLAGSSEKHKSSDIEWLWTQQRGHCVFCLKPLIRGKFHVDHHIPLARGGSNDRKNLRLLHKKCNLEKSWRDPYEHARENGMLLW